MRKVRAATKAIFEVLVPAMEVELACDDPAALAECGARFLVRSKSNGKSKAQHPKEGAAWRTGLHELSGGQRTLLNLSLLLAISQHRPSMLLLMDEVDAALDENNAARVAALLKGISASSQVIAISHRPELHRAADHIIRLHKEKDHTAVS